MISGTCVLWLTVASSWPIAKPEPAAFFCKIEMRQTEVGTERTDVGDETDKPGAGWHLWLIIH